MKKPLVALRKRAQFYRAARRSQVIGICRFSYPALGGFKKEHESPEQRARFLYAPERLDERFHLFEAITLPALRAQSDPDFTFLIVIGQDFPPERLEQLRALTRDMPQVVIQAHPPGRHRDVMKEAINSVRRPGCFSIQFRNDDDDAVNTRFVAKLRKTLADCYPLFEGSRHVAIDFTRGYNVCAGSAGLTVEPSQALMLGVAFAIAFRPDVDLSVMNFTHHEVWQHMPVIARTDPDMWLRGVNGHNDSGDVIGRQAQPLNEALANRLSRAFAIPPEAWLRDGA